MKKSILYASFSLIFAMLFVITGCENDATAPSDDDPVIKEKHLYTLSGIAGQAGLGGQGGPAIKAQHYWPQDILIVDDNIYITDWNNHCIQLITPDGIMERYIGSGLLGDDTDGPKELIDLNHPSNLTLGPDGLFYMSSWHNWKIKVVNPATGILSSPFGTSQGYEGDNNHASQAKFDLPSSCVFDGNGNIFLADQANQVIRMIRPDGTIEPFVGKGQEEGFADGIGEEARFRNPRGSDATPGMRLTISADKKTIYVADKLNHAIRKVDIATKMVTTIAGNGTAGYSGDGGPAVNATLNQPTDVHITTDGTIYFSDEQNHVVRRINTNGTIETVAGSGLAGHSPDGTLATDAQFNRPGGVYFHEPTNTLYVADTFNHQTKKIVNP